MPSNKSGKPKYKFPSIETINRINAKLTGIDPEYAARGGFSDVNIGDSIERRVCDFNINNIYSDLMKEEGYRATTNSVNYIYILNKLSKDDELFHRIIAQCIMGYIEYGLLRVVIELCADFATEGLSIEHDNATVDNFYKNWITKVRLKERINRFYIDMFTGGGVFIHKINAKLSTSEVTKMKKSTAYAQILNEGSLLIRDESGKNYTISPNIEIDDRLSCFTDFREAVLKYKMPVYYSDKSANEKEIPWEYISLPILNMETRERSVGSKGKWVFCLTEEDANAFKNFVKIIVDSEKNNAKIVAPDFIKGITNYKGKKKGIFKYEVELSSKDLYVIFDKKFDNWSWAIPFVYPSLKHLKYKDFLRDLERKYGKSVINSVVLWELGDPELGIMPEDEHFERLADMLQQPGRSMNILWPAPIKAHVIEPKMQNVLDPKKYEEVNRDILLSLGVPDVLLGGKGSNFSNAALSIAAILQRLQDARDKFEIWLMNELKIIADAMGFRKPPIIKWRRSSLKDESAERTFKLALFDRGILSAEALLKDADEDIALEVARQKNEKKIADETGVGVLDKRGPYFRPEELAKLGIMPYGWKTDVNMPIPGVNDKDPKSGTDTGPNGRPPTKKDTGPRKDRTPKPRGIETLSFIKFNEVRHSAFKLMEQIEEKIGKDKPKLFAIMSGIKLNDGLGKISAKQSKINPVISENFEWLKNYYELKKDNKLTFDEQKEIFSYVWSINQLN